MEKNDQNQAINKFIRFVKFIYKSTVKFFTALVLIITVMLAVGFSTLNSQPVTVNYYLGKAQLSLSVLLVSCLVLGIFLGLLALTPAIIQLKYFNRRLEKYIQRTEETLEELKKIQSAV